MIDRKCPRCEGTGYVHVVNKAATKRIKEDGMSHHHLTRYRAVKCTLCDGKGKTKVRRRAKETNNA